jgi:hypothetical protein
MQESLRHRCEACGATFEDAEALRKHVREVGLVG